MSAPSAALSLNELREPIGRLNEKQLSQFFATDYAMAICLNRIIESDERIKVKDSYNFPSDVIFDEASHDKSRLIIKFFEIYIIGLTLQRMISYTLVNDQRVFELQNVTLESPLNVTLESGTPDKIDEKVISYYKDLRRDRIVRDLERANSGSPVSTEVTEIITTSLVSIGDLSNDEKENLLQEALDVVGEQNRINNLIKILFRNYPNEDAKTTLEEVCNEFMNKIELYHHREKLIRTKSEIENKKPANRTANEKIKLSNILGEIKEIDGEISSLDPYIHEFNTYLEKGAVIQGEAQRDLLLILCVLWSAGLLKPFLVIERLLPHNVTDIVNSSVLSSTLGAWSKLFTEGHPGVVGIVVDALPRIESRFRSSSSSQSQQDYRAGGIKLMQNFLDSTITQFRMKEFTDLSNNLSPALALSVFRSLNALDKGDRGEITWSVEDDGGRRLAFNYTMAWITSARKELSTIFQFAFDIEPHKEEYFDDNVEKVDGAAMFPGSLDLTGTAGLGMIIDEHHTQDRRMRLKEGRMKSVGGLETTFNQDGVRWLV